MIWFQWDNFQFFHPLYKYKNVQLYCRVGMEIKVKIKGHLNLTQII